jgi:hypothetical protein
VYYVYTNILQKEKNVVVNAASSVRWCGAPGCHVVLEADIFFFKRKRIRKDRIHTCRPVYLSWNQNAGQNHCIMIDNIAFERVEKFKYLGTTLTNRNAIHD